MDVHPEIVLTFSEAMDHDSVEGALSFTNDERVEVPFQLMWQGNNLRLEPEQTLPFNTAHTITVGTGAMSTRGIYLQEAFALGFTTQTSWPVVVETFPADGETDVVLNPLVSITFNQDMLQQSAEDAISIDPVVGFTFGEWPGDDTVLPVIFDATLATETTYTITVAQTALADGTGEPMQADYVFSFTTGIDSDVLVTAARRWEGMSSGPSAVCV